MSNEVTYIKAIPLFISVPLVHKCAPLPSQKNFFANKLKDYDPAYARYFANAETDVIDYDALNRSLTKYIPVNWQSLPIVDVGCGRGNW